MAIFSSLLSFLPGLTESATVAVPAGLTSVAANMTADNWLDGVYTFRVLLSEDGGLTFPMVVEAAFRSPFNFLAGKPHLCSLQYRRGPGPQITHAKASVNAPLALTTTLTLVAD